MIKPTVGRVVWFCPSFSDSLHPFTQTHGDGRSIRLAAIVVWVHSDRMVNLTVFDPNGFPHSRTSVTLMQDDAPPTPYSFCEWMPYQKGQAAKTDAAEAKADAAALDVSALAFSARDLIGGAVATRLPAGTPIAEDLNCECTHAVANARNPAGVWHCCYCGRLSHSAASDPGRPVPRHGSGP